MEYTYRRYCKDDLPGLTELFQSSFGQPLSLEKATAKHSTEIFGISYVGILAIAPDGALAAFYGVFPVCINHQGQRVLAAQSCDTMTHPDHRGQGLFIELAERTYELAFKLGIRLIYGFPNQNSVHGFRKYLSWSFLPNMQGAELAAGQSKRIYQLKRLLKGEAAITTKIQKNVELMASDEDIVFDENVDGVAKDKAYLTYKATSSGSVVVRHCQLTVWMVPGPRLDIGAFYCHRDFSPAQLHNAIIQLVKSVGAHSARFSYSPGHPSLEAIREFCAIHDSATVGYRVLDPTLEPGELFFCRGDFDYF